MSFEYIAIKRTEYALVLSLTPACASIEPCVLVWWLDATLEMYRRENQRAAFDAPTLALLEANRKAAEESFEGLSSPGRLLFTSAITAYETHLYKGIDKNLQLINAAYEHAKAVGVVPVDKKSIKYSLKKHRDNRALRLMTVRSDVLQDFGFEGGCLALNVLCKAVERDIGLKVSIWNLHEVFDGHSGSRDSPDFVSTQVFFLHRHLVTYLGNNLSLAEVKELLGVIKTLHDYFETQEIPG